MKLEDYQKKALTFIKGWWGNTPDKTHGAWGILAEAGEIAGFFKTGYRKGEATGEFKDDVIDEVGDVLFYVNELLAAYEVSWEEVFAKNIIKLSYREANGKDKKAERKAQLAWKA